MHMAKTIEARRDLALAAGLVQFVADRIAEPDCDDNEKFQLLWRLGFQDLQRLERHRRQE